MKTKGATTLSAFIHLTLQEELRGAELGGGGRGRNWRQAGDPALANSAPVPRKHSQVPKQSGWPRVAVTTATSQ